MMETDACRPIRFAVFLLFSMLALAAGGCQSYGTADQGGQGDDCYCDEPPPPKCADETSRLVYSAGQCVDGGCHYPSSLEDCPGGECADGQCTGCQPDCGDRTCGPDPVCGASCGSCPEDEHCGDDGRCEPGCAVPQYPFDCAEVPTFQCGIEPRCADGVLQVDWHEHVFCDGEEQIVPFYCEHACPAGCAEGPIADWPESGRALVDEYCFTPCDQILLDNSGRPAGYPPTWRDEAAAEQRYREAVDAFRTAYGVAPEAYRFEPHLITYTAVIDHLGEAAAQVAEPGVGEDTIQALADTFLEHWGDLFATTGLTREPGAVTCSGSWCRATQQQTYCGLALEADDPTYGGALSLRVRVDTGGLLDASSAAVPMIPIPANPDLGQDEVRASLVGLVLEYWCADGLHTAEVTEASTFTFEDDPVVFVRATADGLGGLEYRTAFRLQVAPQDWLSWTLFVDGFDGSLLETRPDFICD